ncbi:hypothetical protein [Sphingomonas sp.]|uniref:hypothetical protein n=1 Tax=Sphingomonas sp. TaxID=28214 RepID=UPI003D6D2DD6
MTACRFVRDIRAGKYRHHPAAVAIYNPNELRGLALGIGVLVGVGLGRALALGCVGILPDLARMPWGGSLRP